MTTPAPHLRPAVVYLTDEETRSVRQYVARIGVKRAAKRLGTTLATLGAARWNGRLLRATRDRLLESIAREACQS